MIKKYRRYLTRLKKDILKNKDKLITNIRHISINKNVVIVGISILVKLQFLLECV